MANTILTNWQRYTWQITQQNIDLSGSKLISARIRWRGVSTTSDKTTSSSCSTTTEGANTSRNMTRPAIPSGTTGLLTWGSLQIQNQSFTPQTFTLIINGVTVWSGTVQPGSYSPTITRGFSFRNTMTYTVNSGAGSYRMRTCIWAEYRETLHSVNPSVTVNSVQTAHSGTLTSNQMTSWRTLGGLADFSSNMLSHNAGITGSRQVDVQIEYVYISLPQIKTDDPTDVSAYTAKLRGTLLSAGYAETTRHFRYRKVGEEPWSETSLGVGGTGSFSAAIGGLEVDETYEYQAYATNAAGTVYGNIKTFTTVATIPSVESLPVSNIDILTARLNGGLIDTGGSTTEVGFEIDGGFEMVSADQAIGPFYYDASGLDYDTVYQYRAYAINGISTPDRIYGGWQSFRTLYPYLPAPTERFPEANHQTREQRPEFYFRLGEQAINPAVKYHARIRFSKSVDVDGQYFYEMETTVSQAGWEALIGDEWIPFPSEGVDPETLIRVVPGEQMPLGPIYWDCASFDGDRYGFNASARVIRFLLAIDGDYTLSVGGENWLVIDSLEVVEASNGSIGHVVFTLFNGAMPANLLSKNQSDVEEDLTGFNAVEGDIDLSYEYAWQGARSLLVENTDSQATVNLDPVDVESGDYTASGYLRGEGFITFKLQELDAGDSVIDESFQYMQVFTDRWTRAVVTHRVTDGVKARIEVTGIMGATAEFYADGFQLERSNRATWWNPGGRESDVYYPANEVEYGTDVVLAIRDTENNVEEFAARVRRKIPDGDQTEIVCILGDGFLGERIIPDNYPTDDEAKPITDFGYEEAGQIEKTWLTATDWNDFAANSGMAVSGSSLMLEEDAGSNYYLLGAEAPTGNWAVNLLETSGTGKSITTTKESNHLYIKKYYNPYVYPQTSESETAEVIWSTNNKVNLSNIATIKISIWGKISSTTTGGSEFPGVSIRAGISANNNTTGFTLSKVSTTSFSATSESTYWTLNVSGYSGEYHLKVAFLQARLSANDCEVKMYRFYGLDSDGNVVFSYPASGSRTLHPVPLDGIADVDTSLVEWSATVPYQTSMTIQAATNTNYSSEPATYYNLTNGQPFPSNVMTVGQDLTGRFLWIRVLMEPNPTFGQSPSLSSLKVDIREPGVFGVICTCEDHDLEADDKVWIEGDNRYNGVYNVQEIIDDNTFVLPTQYREDDRASGTVKLLGDIADYIKDMINSYCSPITADTEVFEEAGFVAPVLSKHKTAVAVLEQLRRNYGFYYFVDRWYRLHIYWPDDVVTPELLGNVIRRKMPNE